MFPLLRYVGYRVSGGIVTRRRQPTTSAASPGKLVGGGGGVSVASDRSWLSSYYNTNHVYCNGHISFRGN